MRKQEETGSFRRLAGPALLVAVLLGCSGGGDEPSAAAPPDAEEFAQARAAMVRRLEREIEDPRVLGALARVPRHRFVPHEFLECAYEDQILIIGEGHTIFRPALVGRMTELMELEGGERVLEIGTGSGYQAAVLAEIASTVYSVEIVPELAAQAAVRLDDLGYDNVHVRAADGYQGWPEAAPFDAIVVTAAPEEVPPPLVRQLRPGGHLVIPVGERSQELLQIRRNSEDPDDLTRRWVLAMRTERMAGRAQRPVETPAAGDSQKKARR